MGRVGYRLGDTMSAAGGVNRGICRTADDRWLAEIEEVVDIVPDGPGRFTGRGLGGAIALDAGALVSMNMWAFTPAVFGSDFQPSKPPRHLRVGQTSGRCACPLEAGPSPDSRSCPSTT